MEAVAGLLLMLFGVSHAPVSSVLLVSECLSQGEMRASCSSEGGDSPQYSWTLDGRTLTDAELLSGNNETNIITLKQHVSGHLVCSVSNNVSDVFKEERISTSENGDGQEVYANVGVVAGEAKGENSRAGVNQVFKMNLPD
uniref:protein turtle homolog A n=1 Tax=Maylandia zebra TaxID=106582 RepID=UPI000D3206B4|nr:protein turtle homolog A-like [Maylandia zebra]